MRYLLKHHILQKIEHAFLYTCLGIITSSSLLIGYWLLDPMKIIEITSPVTVNKEVYKPGERIIYTFTYCKKIKKTARVIRTLVNGTQTTFTPIENDLPKGCGTARVSDLIIPEYADAGTYHLEATITYQLNPIRNFNAYWRSEDFIIK